MTPRQIFTAILFFTLSYSSKGQQRLELMETNISSSDMEAYAQSYLWVKNWWLVTGVVPDTSKSGNTFSPKGKLNTQAIDSLSKIFNKYLPADIVRDGNLVPRINFTVNKRLKPYIKTSVYEIDGNTAKLTGLFFIEFDATRHNGMPDVRNIYVFDPAKTKHLPAPVAIDAYKRKATGLENNLVPPPVRNDL